MTARITGATVIGATMLGVATGLRSQMGMTAVVLAERGAALPDLLARPSVRVGWPLLGMGELLLDKLPFAPARTKPSGLVPRISLGALSAGVAASAAGAGPALPAALGATAAVVSAAAGMATRAAMARRFSPLGVAVVEDVVAMITALGAVRVMHRGMPVSSV
jgi:uncharacterized membrane protein